MPKEAEATVARARRRVIRHFTDANATRPSRATAYEPASGIDERQFARLVHLGVIEETGPGLYWFDRAMFDQVEGRNRRNTGIAVGLASAVAVGAFVWLRRRARAAASKD
ncbi:hypothetical protein D1610_04955 [Sphingomonas gilva]|uniref:Uncharacterized protein n=1 Tax=Sphingomonas gilva TaxID=2305907 RepID=A0A396RW17_9SPHN|nr:hypothetical protein [Sphingomonas gilva]RHW17871.1 hypothetical protein D1610_04955 [Sphingomonas gilva]